MSIIVVTVIVFAIIGFYQIPPLVQRQYWKELTAFSVFLVMAFILTLMRVMGLHLPQPNEGVIMVLKHFNLV